jgi:hypothetical protein
MERTLTRIEMLSNRPDPFLRCHICRLAAPRHITDRLTRRVLIDGAPGEQLEVRGWSLTLGGPLGSTIVLCPDHRDAGERPGALADPAQRSA